MSKVIIGIDPGFKIGISLLDLNRLIASEFVIVNVPTVIKRNSSKLELLNWKLKQVLFRFEETLQNMMEEHGYKDSDAVASIESYLYRPGKANAAYNTVAAIAMVKSVLFKHDIDFIEVASKQMRRILTYNVLGYPKDDLDKDGVEGVVRKILGDSVVTEKLKPYANGHHEHIADSMAFALSYRMKGAYEEYMKISLSKRKKMMAEMGIPWVAKSRKKREVDDNGISVKKTKKKKVKTKK